jgi:hypothetical protein
MAAIGDARNAYRILAGKHPEACSNDDREHVGKILRNMSSKYVGMTEDR